MINIAMISFKWNITDYETNKKYQYNLCIAKILIMFVCNYNPAEI